MKVSAISKRDFIDLAYHHTEQLFDFINKAGVYVVKNFYPADTIIKIRNENFNWGISTEPSWHPCYDGVPDFHRIHNNYPKAHVKSKMHAFYHHGFHNENETLFNTFVEIFNLKNFLAGFPAGHFIKNIPSQGQIARVNLHNYPLGGGGQAEHIDPVSKFAILQTIVQASQIGVDYQHGGLYARETLDLERSYLDEHTGIGDLIVLSPGIPHGVAPVDEEKNWDWKINKGRWMILPIIVNSDYQSSENVKPKEI